MCNCISELEEKVKAHLVDQGKFKKPVKEVSMVGKTMTMGKGLESIVIQNFEIELEGQKKKPTTFVKWSYCPFCGEKKAA